MPTPAPPLDDSAPWGDGETTALPAVLFAGREGAAVPWGDDETTTTPAGPAGVAGVGCCCASPPPPPAVCCPAIFNADVLCLAVAGAPTSGPADPNRTHAIERTGERAWGWTESGPGYYRSMSAYCSPDGQLLWSSFEEIVVNTVAEEDSCRETWTASAGGVIDTTAVCAAGGPFTSPGLGAVGHDEWNRQIHDQRTIFDFPPYQPPAKCPQAYSFTRTAGGTGTVTPGPCGGVMMAALPSARTALPVVPCRHRGDDPLPAGSVAALGLNPRIDWHRCDRDGFERAGRPVTECRSCAAPADGRCGPRSGCGGYEPADPEN